jgi:hypothetical protein
MVDDVFHAFNSSRQIGLLIEDILLASMAFSVASTKSS